MLNIGPTNGPTYCKSIESFWVKTEPWHSGTGLKIGLPPISRTISLLTKSSRPADRPSKTLPLPTGRFCEIRQTRWRTPHICSWRFASIAINATTIRSSDGLKTNTTTSHPISHKLDEKKTPTFRANESEGLQSREPFRWWRSSLTRTREKPSTTELAKWFRHPSPTKIETSRKPVHLAENNWPIGLRLRTTATSPPVT